MDALCPADRGPACACENPGHDRRDPDGPRGLPMTRPPLWDGLLLDARLATLDGPGYGLVEEGALAWKDGRIAWVGPRVALPAGDGLRAARVRQAGGRLRTRRLAGCHSALLIGGTRAGEFEQRLVGASDGEIARAGGGIVSTVRGTGAAVPASMLAQSLPRARALG